MRTVLAVLIAISLAFAPVASALAGGHGHGSEMAEMSDCHKEKLASSDCPCCTTLWKCPEQACLLKCLKLLGELRPALQHASVAPVRGPHAVPAKPPDWAHKPPIPPPRS
ncbi:MAG: hypothetical protein F9K29_15500 [Hyphomicrobiaceae bacterium]|nr:MAG: hypothetical protein F9K29_15500 [Hyphomicrobiaceae bacterium]